MKKKKTKIKWKNGKKINKNKRYGDPLPMLIKWKVFHKYLLEATSTAFHHSLMQGKLGTQVLTSPREPVMGSYWWNKYPSLLLLRWTALQHVLCRLLGSLAAWAPAVNLPRYTPTGLPSHASVSLPHSSPPASKNLLANHLLALNPCLVWENSIQDSFYQLPTQASQLISL